MTRIRHSHHPKLVYPTPNSCTGMDVALRLPCRSTSADIRKRVWRPSRFGRHCGFGAPRPSAPRTPLRPSDTDGCAVLEPASWVALLCCNTFVPHLEHTGRLHVGHTHTLVDAGARAQGSVPPAAVAAADNSVDALNGCELSSDA
eukprot:361810-Chlamydomonas_euryale.AAC.3